MKENILFFYKSSHGELHAGLPILMKILSERKELTAYFIYENEVTFNNIPLFYRRIIEKNFEVIHLNMMSFFSTFKKLFFSKNYIITCDLGHTRYTKIFTNYWPISRIIFFHHAYALLNGKRYEIYRNKWYPRATQPDGLEKKYNGGCHDPLVIAHNNTELEYRQVCGFKAKNILIAGNLGYNHNWIEKLKTNSKELNNLEINSKKYEKIIFVPVRGLHENYLSRRNSDYLLDSLDKIIIDFPDYLFLIKTHPRQNNIHEYIKLEQQHENCQRTDLNTITASEISDLVVSFWSSAIVDALVVNTPVVEFHRHHFFHHQLQKKDSSLISLYHSMGLCPFYTEYEQIKHLLENPSSWSEILYEQQTDFHSIFLRDHPEFVEDLMERLSNTSFSIHNYVRNFFKFPLKFALPKIKHIISR